MPIDYYNAQNSHAVYAPGFARLRLFGLLVATLILSLGTASSGVHCLRGMAEMSRNQGPGCGSCMQQVHAEIVARHGDPVHQLSAFVFCGGGALVCLIGVVRAVNGLRAPSPSASIPGNT